MGKFLKKFFTLSILLIFVAISTFSLSGCTKSEVEKVSKGLTNYNFEIEYNDETKQIFGTENLDYKNTTGTELENLCFHLYPRAFRKGAMVKPYTPLTMATCFPNGESFGDISIASVKVNGNEKPIEMIGEDEDILSINFGFKLEVNGKVNIEIKFVLTIPNCTHRLGHFNGNINIGNWYPIVCEFVDGKFDLSPYYSTGDPFFSDIANYEVNFSYPSKYVLCSTGMIETKTNGEKTTAKISAKAVRDFAMCLSENSKIVSASENKTTVSYMGYAADSNLDKCLQISSAAVKFFSDTFGEYPYASLSVVKTPFIYGGMEYPNVVYISDSIDDEIEYYKVIVHEIAHQWWYGIVGNNEVTESWLDESLAEYSTALFFEHNQNYGVSYDDFVQSAVSSYLLYVDVIKTIRGEVNTKMNLKLNEYQNDYEYSYMVYVKGVIMFDSLRQAVGEKKLVQGLKKYYQSNKFKIATKNDFYSAFKSACHTDLDGFFDGYLNGTAIISSISWQILFCF